jgi:O-antigen ligase
MANIYNFLNNVYLKAKNQITNNTLVVLLTLVFFTLPLPYIFNSVTTIGFGLFCAYNLKSHKLTLNKINLVPILLYLLMLISLFWTLDFKTTLDALVKETPLLTLPLCFCIVPVSKVQKDQIVSNFGYVIFGYTLFYLLKAVVRFIISKDTSVFFYHELVTLDVNAIHVSVYCALAFFTFLIKKNKFTIDKIAIILLGLFIFLLSSKNIIITFIVLLIIYLVFYSNKKFKKSEIAVALISILVISTVFFNKAKDRFLVEIESNTQEISINKEQLSKGLVYNVSIYDAWNKDKFSYNDYFPGTAMRVYQIRIFTEMLQQDNIFLTGYGLNASWQKLKEKRIEHNLYPGYEKFNFHNQYIQNFAELGVVGMLLLMIMLTITLINAVKLKDFIHFSFAVLMISLFLTESFLWRQRGVIFFTIFYCLLNANFYKKDSQIE